MRKGAIDAAGGTIEAGSVGTTDNRERERTKGWLPLKNSKISIRLFIHLTRLSTIALNWTIPPSCSWQFERAYPNLGEHRSKWFYSFGYQRWIQNFFLWNATLSVFQKIINPLWSTVIVCSKIQEPLKTGRICQLAKPPKTIKPISVDETDVKCKF